MSDPLLGDPETAANVVVVHAATVMTGLIGQKAAQSVFASLARNDDFWTTCTGHVKEMVAYGAPAPIYKPKDQHEH